MLLEDHADDSVLSTVIGVAKKAGELIAASWGQAKGFDCKDGHSTDLVTQTDRQVEQFIFERLKAFYPKHLFIGEEGVDEASVQLSDAPTWVVDPIDGTTNFIHNFDQTAISIALCVNKRAIVGVIYNPIRKELYYATQGGGAFLERYGNDAVRLTTSSTDDLKRSLVSIELGAAHGEADKLNEKWQNQMFPLLNHPIHGLRQLGAATMNFMAVARGCVEAYIESGLKPWDMAAGELIVREAGGVITMIDDENEPFRLTGKQVIASCNQQISQSIHRVLNSE